MKTVYRNILLFLFILSVTLISSAITANASLSSKYESPAVPDKFSSVKPSASATAKTASQKAVPAKQISGKIKSSSEAAVIWRKKLSAKKLQIIRKEHAKFCKAFVDAEMGLRYFYKTQYDAKYRFKKAPTPEELKAMRFELSLLMKDLGSSAKRYASNIRIARIAMMEMDEEERSFFAKALSQIIGTPAYAIDAGSLSGIETGLNNIANSTADVGLSTEADYASAAMSEANMAKAGEVIASATSLVTTTVLAGTAIVGGAALTMGAVTTGGVVAGGVILVGAIVGGGLEATSSAIGFIDSLTEQETDTKDLKKISTAINVLNVGAGVKNGEVLRVVVDATDATKDVWIPMIFEETEKPNCPGKDGVNKVKNAQKNTSSGGGKGGGGGGCGC